MMRGAVILLVLAAAPLAAQDCRQQWLHNTRAYAKRQLTWFRARPEAEWLPPDKPAAVVEAAQRFWQSVRQP